VLGVSGPAHEAVEQVARLVATASDGLVPVEDAAAGGSLRALGLGSLGFLRLADALEAAYGVELDVVELSDLDSAPLIADRIAGPR